MKPNIVYIMADDMGYGDLSCYDAKIFSTPNIDRISQYGTRFTDMHASSSVCTPSRYSVLTGRYCWRTRLQQWVIRGFGSPLIEHQRATIASVLHTQGYKTAAIGKWHLGLTWYTNDGGKVADNDVNGWNTDGYAIDYAKGIADGPLDLGFDYWFGIAGSLDMCPYCFIENEHTVGIPSIEKTRLYPDQLPGLMAEGWDEELVDITFTNKAVAYIETHREVAKDSPFFLYFTPSAPHRPCVPPLFIRGSSGAGDREDMVQLVDWSVGQILEALEKTNQLENTLIIVTSDNGAHLTNANGKDYGHKPNGDFRGGKGDIYEGGHRVPFVAMWPKGIPEGLVSHHTACLTDVFSTLADLTGYDIGDGIAEDSVSFYDHLIGAIGSQQSEGRPIVHHSMDGMFALRKGGWKAIFGSGSGGFSEPKRYVPQPNEPIGQLYQIEEAHRENNNVWALYPDIVDSLAEILAEYRTNGKSR